MTLIKRLSEALWLAALAVAFLYFNPFSMTVFEPDKVQVVRLIAIGSAVLMLPLLAFLAYRTKRWPLVTYAIFAVMCSFLLSTADSLLPAVSMEGSPARAEGTLTLLAFVVICATIASFADRQSLDRLVTGAILLSLPVSAYVIAQHFGLDFVSHFNIKWSVDTTLRPIATLGNPDFVGSLLVMTLVLTQYRGQTEHRPGAVLSWLAVEIVQLIALYLTHDIWAGIVGLLAVVAMWRVLGVNRPRLHPTVRILQTVFTLLAVASCYVVFEPQIEAHRLSADTRLEIWTEVGTLIAERPVLGWGPETLPFTFAASPRLRQLEGPLQADRSHNAVLDIAYERGIVGLLTDAFLAIATILLVIKQKTAFALAIGVMLIAHFVDSLSSIEPAATQLLAWCGLGALLARERQENA